MKLPVSAMKIFFLTLILLPACLFFGGVNLVAQNADSVQRNKEYTQLEEALKVPEKVYRLNLSNQYFKEFPRELSMFKNLHRALVLVQVSKKCHAKNLNNTKCCVI